MLIDLFPVGDVQIDVRLVDVVYNCQSAKEKAWRFDSLTQSLTSLNSCWISKWAVSRNVHYATFWDIV